MNDRWSRIRLAACSTTVIYWLGLFIVTHLPPTRLLRTRVSDRVEHFVSYAILAGLLLWSLRQLGLSPRAAAWWVVGICLVYGAIDEWLQTFVGRICSFDDWLADATGALTVVAVAIVIGAMRDARQA